MALEHCFLRGVWTWAELEVPALAAEELVLNRRCILAAPGVLPDGVAEAAGFEIPFGDAVVGGLELAPERDSGMGGVFEAANAGVFACVVDVGVDGPGVQGQRAGFGFELMGELPFDGPHEEEGEDFCSQLGGQGVESVS